MTIAQVELDGERSDSQIPKISECEYAASYSWISKSSPTILVPEPARLPPDSGQYFRDPNAARHPDHPTEPAVQALLTQQPQFPTQDIDVFACGSTMGNLLRFARRFDRTFRFNVEVVGNTVFFVRKENSPSELLQDVRGYGHTFPENYTSWEPDVKGSESHQRLVQYSFGGLKFLVRFESDGYYKQRVPGQQSKKPLRLHGENEMSNALQDLDAFGIKSSQSSSTSNKPLQVMVAGEPIPQSSVFDIKTRWAGRPIDMGDMLPVLWVKQISNVVLGYNDHGIFHDIREQDVQEDVKEWEESHADELKRLVVLIHKIVEFARAEGEGVKLEINRPPIGDDGDELEIRNQAGDGVDALPLEMKVRWIGNESPESEAADSGAEHYEDERFNPNLSEEDASDEDSFEGDYTACSAEGCGYCGRCKY
ncbi:hypothetical protein NA57DRAFT_67799 [Rhizodiscina lignyota]|uniref:Geranylgeranyl pyrophosphate synthetase n=1 Tax=Rhizodiscina lignyota TaxID=1504668 RepID=A0A9P4I9H6_9PEZI|nr:hypothetical protein NA57DRAFT_67799 [Rhizodiscina lignyota]